MGPVRFILILLAVALSPAPLLAGKRIALTFDDVPRSRGAFLSPEERTGKLISALQAARVRQAAFFINPGRLDTPDGAGGEARISAYVRAGHVIANHSFSHPFLNKSSAADYLADIDKAEQWLKGRTGYRPWFRFPYLDEGAGDKDKRDAVRAGLAARGLRNGYVTADGSDWHLEALAVDAVKVGRALDMEALRKLYVSTQVAAAEHHDVLARRTIGRSPAHVLLLHETDLAALFIGDLVAELRANGWTIITADKAFTDPVSTAMPDVPYAWGTLTGAMAWEKNVARPLFPMWFSTDMMNHLFEKRVLKKDKAQ